MYTIVASTTLPYAPAAVFAALASIEGTVRWQAGVRAVRRARAASDGAGPPAVVLHYWALGVRHALRATVTVHEPPERFAYRAVGHGLAWDATYTVAPGLGGCHVTCTVVLGASDALDASDASAAPGVPRALPTADAVVRLRRLLARRLPRDLARLEAWVAVQPGARLPGAPAFAPALPHQAHGRAATPATSARPVS